MCACSCLAFHRVNRCIVYGKVQPMTKFFLKCCYSVDKSVTRLRVVQFFLQSHSWLTNPTPASQYPDFVNHSNNYRPNWTPLGPITTMNRAKLVHWGQSLHNNYNFNLISPWESASYGPIFFSCKLSLTTNLVPCFSLLWTLGDSTFLSRH